MTTIPDCEIVYYLRQKNATTILLSLVQLYTIITKTTLTSFGKLNCVYVNLHHNTKSSKDFFSYLSMTQDKITPPKMNFHF